MPFGGVESETQQIAWPPEGDFVMSVAGFHDALSDAVPVWVNNSLSVPVVSPAGLLLLKLLAWNERRDQKPGRDASDLVYVLRHAVKLISEGVLFEEHLSVVDRLGYDVDLAAVYVLGGKIRALAPEKTQEQLLSVLAPLATEAEEATLVRDITARMPGEDSERVGARLRQLKAGFEAKPGADSAWPKRDDREPFRLISESFSGAAGTARPSVTHGCDLCRTRQAVLMMLGVGSSSPPLPPCSHTVQRNQIVTDSGY